MTSDHTPVREDTAFHEAGHAVIGCVLRQFPLRATIVRDDGGNAGKVEFDPPPNWVRESPYFDRSQRRRDYVESLVMRSLAGSVAHDIKCPGREHDEGDLRDGAHAEELLSESEIWSDPEFRAEALADLKAKCRNLLKKHWDAVVAIALALMDREQLSRDEILVLFEKHAAKT